MTSATSSALRTELGRYSLKMQGLLGRRTPVPMLSGYWQNDPFSPEEDSRLIARSSAEGQLLPVTFSPVMKSFDQALLKICDWIEKRLAR
jgi:esterase FrsA